METKWKFSYVFLQEAIDMSRTEKSFECREYGQVCMRKY
jgi:hypothetical protein